METKSSKEEVEEEIMIKPIINHRDILPLVEKTMPGDVYQNCIDVIDHYQNDRKLFGYYKDNRLIGCCGYVILEHKTWISWTAVEPDYQSKGIGRQLLRHTLAYVDAESIYVETYEHPAFFSAIQFYLKNGFRLCGFMENHLKDGSSILYFKKKL